MSLRRLAPFALAFGALACQPSLPPNTNPQYVDYAVFDPALGLMPTPNDIVLANAASVPGAQGEVLRAFAANGCTGTASFPACGGWPSDQEIPITVGFIRAALAGGTSAPDLDPTKIAWCPGATCNATLLEIPPAAGAFPAPVDPGRIKVEYAAGTTGGTMLIRHWDPTASAYRPWNAGSRYIVALRGGAKGLVKAGGGTVEPQPTMWLLLQDKDLSDPANQSLLPGATPAEKAATGAQLETLRRIYAVPAPGSPLSIFGVVDSQFPHREIAVLASFNIVGGTYAVVDPVAGKAPLPFDLLMDPTTGRVANNPAFCQGAYTPGSNPPTCALAQGLASLDGFSTTAMIVAPLSGYVVASTVTKGTVFLYDLTNPAAPVRVPDATQAGGNYVSEPPAITATVGGTAVAPIIGLQPAVPVPLTDSLGNVVGFLSLPPLKEKTPYAVVVTDGVKDTSGKGLVRSTFANLVLGTQSPLVVAGAPQVQGVDAATLTGVQAIRDGLAGVFASLPAGVTKKNVQMAYTFRTESITGKGAFATPPGDPGLVQIAAIPYTPLLPGVCAALGAALAIPGLDCTKPFPASTVVSNTAAVPGVFDRYGVDSTVPKGNIESIIETQIVTVNKLDNATGAFNPSPSGALPEIINVLIAVPNAASAPTCAGPLVALSPAKCPSLVIFHHGLGGGRAAMLQMADSYAAQGFVVAAIDAPKHGDRSHCNALASLALHGDPNFECLGSGVTGFCVADPALAGQGDAPAAGGLPSGTPGLCRTGPTTAAALGPFKNQPALCINAPCTFTATNPGVPIASGEYFISANFFRTRDTFRQDAIDHAQLIQVLEPQPTGAAITGSDVYNALLGKGLFISPLTTYWSGESLGAILGTLNAAANPRISKAVLTVGGGTLFDLFTNSPSFKPSVDALLASLGVDRTKIATDPAMAQKYLLLSGVAKWILDPADPINFAGRLTGNTLPNLLPPLGGAIDGSVAQSPKALLSQVAVCDQTVGNPFNALLAGDIGLSPLFPPAAPGTLGTVEWFLNSNGPAVADVYPGSGCPANMRMPHGFSTDWGAGLSGADQTSVAAGTLQAQQDAATFLLNGTLPSTLVVK